jgi:HEAT repeat protein
VRTLSDLLVERVETLTRMEQMFKSKNRDFFVSLLTNPDRVIRIRALSVLEVIGDASVIEPVGQVLLKDTDPVVRHEAAYVLGQLGYSVALRFLERAVQEDREPIVRHESAVAIGVIGNQTSRRVLEKVIAEDREEIVRFSAEIALTNLDYLASHGRDSEFSKLTGG